ncbi:MAG: DUF2853 family protein [Actinobacteria bacterium]|jgi:hypothetical protein|nr:DUF2853 family protein [Actinomycetota bacterium]
MSALEDISKYVSSPDEAVIEAMEKTYALALSNADARQVSFSDADELKTVRENFVKKKLGVTDSDDDIDAVIRAVGERVPGHKQRLTVYYLLAEQYGKLGVFA